MQYYPQTFNMTEVVLITNSYIIVIYFYLYILHHIHVIPHATKNDTDSVMYRLDVEDEKACLL